MYNIYIYNIYIYVYIYMYTVYGIFYKHIQHIYFYVYSACVKSRHKQRQRIYGSRKQIAQSLGTLNGNLWVIGTDFKNDDISRALHLHMGVSKKMGDPP